MLVPYRIPEFQQDYHQAPTKRERGAILARFALKMGIGGDNPTVWKQIHSNWIEPMLEKKDLQ